MHGGGAFRSHPISGVAATGYLRVSDPSSPYSEQVIINATTGFSTFSSAFVYADNRARASPPSSPAPLTYKGLTFNSLLNFWVGGGVGRVKFEYRAL